MAAGRHHRPAPNVVDAFRPRPRGVEDLAREGGVRGRHLDPGAVGDGPADVAAGVVRPEGRVDGARHPVEHDVGQEHVLGEAPLDVAAAVAPGPKLFHDPGRQADRRVREPVGEGLGPRALNPLVARLLALPVEQGLEIRSVLLRRVRGGRQVAPEPEEGHVDADQAARAGQAEPGRHEGAPVAALGGEAPVAEHVRHEPGEELGDLGDAQARLVRSEGVAVAGQRGRHDREGVGGIPAVPARVREEGDQPVELPHRPRPPVGDEQGQGVRPDPRGADEVQVQVAHRYRELRELVEPGLLGAPVISVAPVGDELLHVGEARAVAPALAGNLVRPAHALEARPEVGQDLVGDADRERPRRHWVVILPEGPREFPRRASGSPLECRRVVADQASVSPCGEIAGFLAAAARSTEPGQSRQLAPQARKCSVRYEFIYRP